MPIKPENKHRYPKDWDAIRRAILRRAGNRCENCGLYNHTLVKRPGGRKAIYVVLTLAHLDHTPENNDPKNLKALCQLCHNTYDADHRAETRRATWRKKKRQHTMFGEEDDG